MPTRSPKTIAVRAAVGFALVAAVTAVAIFASASLSFRAADERERILTTYADDLMNAAGVQTDAERMVAAGRGYLLTSSPELLTRVQEARTQLDMRLDALDREQASAIEVELQRSVRERATRYEERLDELVRRTPENEDRLSLARVLRDELLPIRADLDAGVEALVVNKQRLHREAKERTAQVARRTVRATAWLGIVSLATSLGLAWRFTRRLDEIYRSERESSRRAAAALAAKGEILRIVAHDLRSPLTSISLRAASLARGHQGDKGVEAPATAIRATCERMAGLIDGLVQAASIEAGRLSLRLDRCSIAEVLAAVAETFGPAARQAGIALEQGADPPDLALIADRGRLIQALSNLVGNALKFTSAGGRVRVSADATGGGVTFTVADSGQGIAPQDVPNVFQRFWTRDSSARGSGLGLYITKGIIEAHGGHIAVESRLGEGTTFRFDLPATPDVLGGADHARAGARLGPFDRRSSN
jgi:signal transduction histidine kinase